jgi:hypothetical protein
MRPEAEMIPVLIDAAKALKGSQRRLFMARTVYSGPRKMDHRLRAYLSRAGFSLPACGITGDGRLKPALPG